MAWGGLKVGLERYQIMGKEIQSTSAVTHHHSGKTRSVWSTWFSGSLFRGGRVSTSVVVGAENQLFGSVGRKHSILFQ